MLKNIFIFITLIHGLIHFMGFTKAFGYGNITQLTKEITKPTGLVWFITGILFIICIASYLLKKDSWVYFALIAVVLSQILIIDSWQDAKFGTIANVIVWIVVTIGFFQNKFKDEYKNEVKNGLEQNRNLQKKMLNESEIAYLPKPVQNYIRYTGFLNKPIVENFRIDFVGKIRDHAKPVWMQLTSEQYNFISTPTRLFY